MDLSQILSTAGVDYKSLITRFSGNEAMLKKFLLKLPQDKTYKELQEKISQRDMEGILACAHTLKGISANLGFDRLSSACADVVSAVRGDRPEDAVRLCAKIDEEYDTALGCISKIES